jgi:hypothetical protein
MGNNRRNRVVLAAVLGVVALASSPHSASADPTWFTAIDTHAENIGPLDLDDGGVIRHGISDAGNIGLRLIAGGGDQPAVYTRSTGVTTLLESVGAGSVTPQGTDSPVRAMATNGFAAGYFKNPSNTPYVYNPGGPFGTVPTPGYDTGFSNIGPRTSSFGRANSINGLGRVIGDGSGTRVYFPQDTAAGEFTTGHVAGEQFTIAGLTANSLNDRTEIVATGNFAGRPAQYVTDLRVPAFQLWFPSSQASRWSNSDTGTVGTVGTVTPEAINTVFYPLGNGATGRTFVAGTGTLQLGNSVGRDIAASGDVAGYTPDGSIVTGVDRDRSTYRGFIYRRSSKTFGFADPLAGDTTSTLIGINNGAIGVGNSYPLSPFTGPKPSKGIIYNQSFGSAPVDLNRVTAGIPAGYNIFNAFGISSYNGDGTHRFYIAAYASTGANGSGTIKALLLQSSMGDFVGGGNGVNAADINALNSHMGGDPNTYDLTGDGLVDSHDRDMIVQGVLGEEYGDVNLDNVIDSSDFTALAANFNTSGNLWEQGDFNADGLVNALDFNAIASHYGFDNGAPAVPTLGQPAIGGALVPEPTAAALVSLAALLIRRRSATRAPRI